MGKMIIKEKDLKGAEKIIYKDKDTNEFKGISYIAGGEINIDEKSLKSYNIHLLDKVVAKKDDGEEEEIGTVSEHYTEEEK